MKKCLIKLVLCVVSDPEKERTLTVVCCFLKPQDAGVLPVGTAVNLHGLDYAPMQTCRLRVKRSTCSPHCLVCVDS